MKGRGKAVRIESYENALQYLASVSSAKSSFFETDKARSDALTKCMKHFYVASKQFGDGLKGKFEKIDVVGELFTDGVDVEQVWGQLDLINNPVARIAEKSIANLVELPEDTIATKSSPDESSDEEPADEKDASARGGSAEDGSSDDQSSGEEGPVETDEDGKDSSSVGNGTVKKGAQADTVLKEDSFFSASDFNAFADGKEDLGMGEMGADMYGDMYDSEGGSGDDVDTDEEQAILDKGINKKKKSSQKNDEEANALLYNDFFDAPNKTGMEKEEESDLEEDLEESSSAAGDAPAPETATTVAVEEEQSKHQKYLGAKGTQIEELEKEMMQPKRWNMLGESSKKSRPEDSLLSLDLNYQRTVKVAPTITADSTERIEDIIKSRIVDELWDDVIRVEKKTNEGNDKKEAEVSTEKSAVGLGDIYAKQYEEEVLGNSSTKSTETTKAHEELDRMWQTLSQKLDSLSSYHFAPKPSINEISIATAAPSIQMEEVLPVSVSTADQFTPEEIFKRKRGRQGVLKGSDELDKNDRAKNRNAKKAVRRRALRAKKKEQKLKAQNGGYNSSYNNKLARDTVQAAKNVVQGVVSRNDTNFKSSAFFASLNDDTKPKKKKKKTAGIASSNLKL
jgi:U3 small nucleolar RNA-associated protein MPP10